MRVTIREMKTEEIMFCMENVIQIHEGVISTHVLLETNTSNYLVPLTQTQILIIDKDKIV